MLKTLLALITAAMFAGVALYISIAEHPARMRLDDQAGLTEWRASYARAAPLQASLTLVSMLLGLWAWYKIQIDWLLVGALSIGAAVPFTLLAFMPLNRRLKAAASYGGGSEGRVLLSRWGKLHALRTLLGLVAVGAYFAAFAQP